jgi:hypothetical protein
MPELNVSLRNQGSTIVPEAKKEKDSWKQRIISELRSLSVTVIYIWVFLSVFTLHREIILANHRINYSVKFGFAFINAVILAKFMWLGEILHAGKTAARKPLLYSTLWYSALFTAILMICHLLEEALVEVWHGQSFTASFSEAVAHPKAIFATMLVVFVVLIPFFLAKGLIEILGKDEIKRLLLNAHTEGSARQSGDGGNP